MLLIRPLLLLIVLKNAQPVSTSFHQHWIDENSNLQVPLERKTVYLFCFHKPHIYEWAVNCLKDFDVSLQLNTSLDWSKNSHVSVDIYDGPSEHVFLGYRSCSSLDSLMSSPTSIYFSFLYSTSADVRKRSLSSSGLHWTIPSYPSSCFALCMDTHDSLFGPSLMLEVHSVFNEKNVFTALLGFILLIASDYLSTTLSFYYLWGTGCVVLGSLIIVFFIFIRLLPVKRGSAVLQATFVLLGGTFSLACMLLDYVRSSLIQFFTNNAEFTLMYVVFVAFSSLLCFYWFHIPERIIVKYPRTRTIMKYLLRFFGATLIVRSVHLPFTEAELIDSLSNLLGTFSVVESFPPSLLQLTRLISPRLMWFGLILGLVLLVDSLYFVCALTSSKITNESTIKMRHASRISPCSDVDVCLPGSPWASSSPYQMESEDAYFRSPRPISRTPGKRASMPRSSMSAYNMDYVDSTTMFVSSNPRVFSTVTSAQKRDSAEILTEDESE